MFDPQRLKKHIDGNWDDAIVPSLVDYIKIPNKSPAYDADWEKHGYMDDAVKLMEAWARARLSTWPGATMEVVKLKGRTPVLFFEIPGEGDDTVLLYGHLDKQPEMKGWWDGFGPWTPVIKDNKLYGRGGADDGYAMYGSLAALQSLKDQGVPHSRCVILIEACEESGSYDLRSTSIIWRSGSVSHRSSCAWIRGAGTTISCGSPHRCAAMAWAR
jgi:acetylornithine deacetylase/succinyl-diaminopimelate desuccinylase-like protein